MRRFLVALALLLTPFLAQHSSPAHAQPRTVITEEVRLTYYYPTGRMDASSHWPIEGYTAGCGYDVPIYSMITLASGKVMQCRDHGNTYGPWIDFYVESEDAGWWLILNEAGGVCYATGCYATVTFSY